MTGPPLSRTNSASVIRDWITPGASAPSCCRRLTSVRTLRIAVLDERALQLSSALAPPDDVLRAALLDAHASPWTILFPIASRSSTLPGFGGPLKCVDRLLSSGWCVPGPCGRPRLNRRPAVGAQLEPILNGGVLDDPPPSDQRRLQLPIPDRASHRPVLAPRKLRDFLAVRYGATAHFFLPAYARPPKVAHRHDGQICKGPLNVPPVSDGTRGAPSDYGVVEAAGDRSGLRFRACRSSARVAGDCARVSHRVPDAICVQCSPPTVRRHLALDEFAESDTRRRRSEGHSVRRPCLVAHVNPRHPVTRRPSLCFAPVFPLSATPPHVCNAYDAPDGESVCCEGSERQGRISSVAEPAHGGAMRCGGLSGRALA